ncbi:FYVE_ RhoGEF and PH domaincontaining protein 4like, partial [Caligus rogercresseyi]
LSVLNALGRSSLWRLKRINRVVCAEPVLLSSTLPTLVPANPRQLPHPRIPSRLESIRPLPKRLQPPLPHPPSMAETPIATTTIFHLELKDSW